MLSGPPAQGQLNIAAPARDLQLSSLKAAQARRQAAQQGLHIYALPVYNDTVGDADVLRLADEADSLLAYFSGEGPAPTQFETTTDPALEAAASGSG